MKSSENAGYMVISKNSWKCTMVTINLALLFIGTLVIAFGIWAITSTMTIWVRTKWDGIPAISIFSGVMLLVISGYGLWGAHKPNEVEKRGSLICYFNILLLLFIAQSAAIAILANDLVTINSYVEGVDSRNLDAKIRAQITNSPQDWLQTQNALSCCGYNSLKGPFATGDACPHDEENKINKMNQNQNNDTNNMNKDNGFTTDVLTVPVCEPLIVAAAVSEMEALLIFNIIVLVLEIIAAISTILLCCFEKNDGASNPYGDDVIRGKYAPLSGGEGNYDEDDSHADDILIPSDLTSDTNTLDWA